MKVLPKSVWAVYSMVDVPRVERMLAPNMKVANVSVLTTGSSCPGPVLLFNAYDVKSKWMTGHRVEVLTIGRDTIKGSVHFVVLDCLSNTLQWDPERGIRFPNAWCTTNHGDRVFELDVNSGSGRFCVRGKYGKLRALRRQFAVDANRACYFRSASLPYAMRFEDRNVMLPVRDLEGVVVTNNQWAGVRSDRPTHVFMHEQEMSFDVDGLPF